MAAIFGPSAEAQLVVLDPRQMVTLVRLAEMTRRMLSEARGVRMDEASSARVWRCYRHAADQVAAALPADLASELGRLRMADAEDGAVGVQARIASAQLLGWLEGFFRNAAIRPPETGPLPPDQTSLDDGQDYGVHNTHDEPRADGPYL